MPAPKENSFPKRKVQKKQRFFQTKTLVQKSTPRPKESFLPETETLPRKGNLFSFRNEISLPNDISHSKNLRPASADKNRQEACSRGLVQDRGRVGFATPNTPPVLQKSTVREDEASVKKNFTYSTENFFFQTKSLVKKIWLCHNKWLIFDEK